MALKRFLILALTLTLVLALAACGGEEKDDCSNGHVDADENGICDRCTELLDLPDPETDPDFSVNIKDESGAPVANATVTVSDNNGAVVAGGKTDANGNFKGTVAAGPYFISFDIDLDGYIYVPGDYINIESGSDNAFSYTTIDNTPDGSAAKPFFLGLDESTHTIPAGATYTFTIKGEKRTLVIENANVTVVYAGTSYTTTGEKLEISVSGPSDANDPPTAFTVTNNSSEDQQVNLKFVSLLGSRQNPIAIEAGEHTVPMTAGASIYYYFIATTNSSVTLTAGTEGNYFKIENFANSLVSNYTDGTVGSSITLENVSAGDKIVIEISNTADDAIDMTFTIEITESAE